ncbi:hypothetical protein [Actinomadura keratinilytica]|uniref:hypothetical protein n=1 Tax=Actinomadura keratinilytica TaxID=547461 RepID=UPI00360C4AD9
MFTGLRTRVLADQTLWSLGLIAALVLAYVGWATRRAAVAVPVAAALALTAVGTAGLRSSHGQAAAPAPVALACREWPLTVCVHPALRDALPALSNAATPLAARLAGTPSAFNRVEQRPEREPARVAGGVAVVHLRDLSPGFEARAVRQIQDALVDGRACAASLDPAAAEYRALVDAWLLGREAPAISDRAAARRFRAWREETRRAWLRRHYTDYRHCALGPGHFRPSSARPGLTRRGLTRRGLTRRDFARPYQTRPSRRAVVHPTRTMARPGVAPRTYGGTR